MISTNFIDLGFKGIGMTWSGILAQLQSIDSLEEEKLGKK